MNAQQQRALAVMEELLQREREGARIKSMSRFLCSTVENPAPDALPQSWAHDWCEGWAFKPSFSHADALGLLLAQRQRTETTLEDGQEVRKRHRYQIWVQTSAFDFRAGYVIHSSPSQEGQTWARQLPHIQRSVQVVDAMQASPGGRGLERDPGFVRFCLYYPAADGTRLQPAMTYTLTQDDFVRYLVSGVLGKEIEPVT